MKQNTLWLLILILLLVFLVIAMLRGNDSETDVIIDEASQSETINDNESQSDANEGDTKEQLTVSYTSEGFSPFIIEVNAGNTVTFENNSEGTMWVTSEGHPTARDQNYPEFNDDESVGPGETYSFMFTKPGAWGYKNLNNEDHIGTVVVIPQE